MTDTTGIEYTTVHDGKPSHGGDPIYLELRQQAEEARDKFVKLVDTCNDPEQIDYAWDVFSYLSDLAEKRGRDLHGDDCYCTPLNDLPCSYCTLVNRIKRWELLFELEMRNDNPS